MHMCVCLSLHVTESFRRVKQEAFRKQKVFRKEKAVLILS